MFLEVYPRVIGASTIKLCRTCGEIKPIEDFHRDKNAASGRTGDCKECARKRSQEWADANRERKHEYDKAYREKNSERRAAVKREWYSNNKEAIQKRGAEWYERNRDRVLDYQRQYQQANYNERREYARRYRLTDKGRAQEESSRQKRRARKWSAQGSHTKDDLIAIRSAQTDKRGRLRCWWCGKPINGTAHLDHKIALSKGGSNDAGNLCYACQKCNLNKMNKTPQEWAGRLL